MKSEAPMGIRRKLIPAPSTGSKSAVMSRLYWSAVKLNIRDAAASVKAAPNPLTIW